LLAARKNEDPAAASQAIRADIEEAASMLLGLLGCRRELGGG
jgi:hypothetical protein